MQNIDLEPSRFRAVLTKPLAKPGWLWAGVVVFGAGTALGVWAAFWYRDTIWAAMIPVPAAIFFGISIAGLFPGLFFNERN